MSEWFDATRGHVLTLVVLAAVVGSLLWPRRRGPLAGAGGPLSRDAAEPAAQDARERPTTRPATADEVADALVLLVVALRSGLSVTDALDHVARVSTGRVSRDLASVVAGVAWGLEMREAWARAPAAWRPAQLAFTMAASTGASPSVLLAAAARQVREQSETARAKAAARAGVLLVLPLGLGFLPAFACTAVVPVVLALAAGALGG